MSYRVDNAIIMAAGCSSRFAPLSYEHPKALIRVKGEILIERQICQLKEAGITSIVVVVGYKKEQLQYLKEKFGIEIVENREFAQRNNHCSIYAVKEFLGNSYICSADNYFTENPFETVVEEGYYSAVYEPGKTSEWCLTIDENNWITGVTIGGSKEWYMLGHAFWTEAFSRKFMQILENEYEKEETKGKLWENIYMEHLDVLKLQMRRYRKNQIYEFDSLEELREFDPEYKIVSGSAIMKDISKRLTCREGEIVQITPITDLVGISRGFEFSCQGKRYVYEYNEKQLREEIGCDGTRYC